MPIAFLSSDGALCCLRLRGQVLCYASSEYKTSPVKVRSTSSCFRSGNYRRHFVLMGSLGRAEEVCYRRLVTNVEHNVTMIVHIRPLIYVCWAGRRCGSAGGKAKGHVTGR